MRVTCPGNRASTRAANNSILDAIVNLFPGDGAGATDLVLQLQNAVQQRFGGGWTTRHIHIHRYDAVAAAHYRIGVMIVAATVGA